MTSADQVAAWRNDAWVDKTIMFGLAMQKASEAGVYRIASGYQVSTGVAMAKSGVGADEPDR